MNINHSLCEGRRRKNGVVTGIRKYMRLGERPSRWWRIRCGDHLPPHIYVRNTCGTTPTEHLLNAGRRPQTSPKARNSPRTWPCD